jgi:hypothetical protein
MEYNVVHGSFCAKANHPVELGGDFAWTAVEQWRTFEMVAGGITSPSVKGAAPAQASAGRGASCQRTTCVERWSSWLLWIRRLIGPPEVARGARPTEGR